MGKVGDLSRLHEKYYSQGFRVVALSDEPIALIRSKLQEKSKAKFWLGSDPENKTLPHFIDGGSIGIPHFYLVDASGEVVGEGLPSEARIEELLKQIIQREHDREIHSDLDEARQAYDAGLYGVAWREAGKLLKKKGEKDPAAVEDAGFLRARVEDYAAHLRGIAEADRKRDRVKTTYGQLLILEKRFAGLEVASWAKTERKALSKERKISADKKAWKALETALVRELKAKGVEWKLKIAAQSYRKVVDSYRRTEAGRLAAEAVKRLGG